jgi:hypothetical protein
MPLGAPNWRSPNWPSETPSRANFRGLGVADLATAIGAGVHRSSGSLALHALEVMHAILHSGAIGQSVLIRTDIERPAPLGEKEAADLWRGETRALAR